MLLTLGTGCKHTAETPSMYIYYSENPAYTPEDIVLWDAVVYTYDSKTCSSIYSLGSITTAPKINPEEVSYVATVASDGIANLNFSSLKAGADPASYYVSAKGDMPRIYASVGQVEGSNDYVVQDLKPITATLNVTYKGSFWAYEGFTLDIADAYDRYFPCTGEFTSNEDVTLEVGTEEYSTRIFPVAKGGSLGFTVHFDNGDTKCDIPLEKGISAGDNVSISLNFSDVESTHNFKLNYSNASTGESGTLDLDAQINETNLYENTNPYYNVFYQNSEGKWISVEVRNALVSNANKYHGQIWNDWDNSKALRDTMCYAIFEDAFSGPVKVRVQKRKESISSVEVRPTPYGISTSMVSDDMVEFTLPSYDQRKVSVEFNGDRYHNLFLFPARPDADKPDPNDSNVKYYAAGEHKAGTITLTSNQTLYIDYGAVVYGEVVVKGDNCTIAGHGVLCGSKLRHYGESYSYGDILVNCNPDREPDRTGLTIKDITMIDSPSWTLSIYNYNDVVVDGINQISWILNGDGIDIVCANDVEVKNCFLRNYDDCITLKVRHNASPVRDLYDVRVHDNLIWNDYAGGIMIGIENGNKNYNTGYIHDVTVEDCIILENCRSTATSDLRAGFGIALYASPDYSWAKGTANNMENITARNLIFDNICSSGRNVTIMQYAEMDETCTLSNVTLENFTIYDNNKTTSPTVYINANQHSIKNLKVKNLVFDGTKITGPCDEFVANGDVDVSFE